MSIDSGRETFSVPLEPQLTEAQQLVVDEAFPHLQAMHAEQQTAQATLPADHDQFPNGSVWIGPYYMNHDDNQGTGVWGVVVENALDARLTSIPTGSGQHYSLVARGEDRKFGQASPEDTQAVVNILGLLAQSAAVEQKPLTARPRRTLSLRCFIGGRRR